MTKPTELNHFDPRAFRRALGNFATGVTIVTAQGPTGDKAGVTASSFNSVSLDPPLVLWSCSKASHSSAIFEAASHFAVNILAADQAEMSNHFARQQDDKFAQIEWQPGIGGAPLFADCSGRFQCETYQKIDGGDHWIFIGKVVAFDDNGRPPLCFHQGAYSMVFSHPGSMTRSNDGLSNSETEGRAANHTFFLMLRAVRAYQDRYQPKLEALDLTLIESRSLLVMNDLEGLSAAQLMSHLNAPIAEVTEALMTLRDRGLIVSEGSGYRLTESGQGKSDQCWDLAYAHAEETFESFDDAKVDDFKDVLRLIIKN